VIKYSAYLFLCGLILCVFFFCLAIKNGNNHVRFSIKTGISTKKTCGLNMAIASTAVQNHFNLNHLYKQQIIFFQITVMKEGHIFIYELNLLTLILNKSLN
jgi:hypothetical protein